MTLLNKYRQGFTLVELLLVIGILVIIATAALIAINPLETANKARDAQRIKQVQDLQKIMEQWMQESTATTAFTAVSTANAGSNACNGTGWLSGGGINVCAYANSVVVDPINKAAQTYQRTADTTTGIVAYEVIYDGAQKYRICTHLQSQVNRSLLTTDGGSHAFAYEISNVTATGIPACAVIN